MKRRRRLAESDFSAFVARKRQTELLGVSGPATFATVFKTDSEQVLVLYRKGWGQTPFTRIESDALQDRRLLDGNDGFLKLVILDTSLVAGRGVLGIQRIEFLAGASVCSSFTLARGPAGSRP